MSGASALFSTASTAASPYVQVIVGSKFALSGVALTLAGFFGIFGVISLQPQNAIISAYVCFFGLTLLTFAINKENEVLAKYFGFMYRENGQLYFLLVAGNLAWTTGILGILAAAFTNFVAYISWQNAVAQGSTSLPQLPSWLGGGRSNAQETASATGMADLQRDDLL